MVNRKHFIKKVIKSEWKGSFTIEAAVLLPLIMVIIVAMIFISFYIHDSVILRAVSASEILEQAGQGMFEPAELRSAVEQALGERLIILKAVTVTVEGSEENMKICCSGSFSYGMKWISHLFGDSFRLAETSVEISCLDSRNELLIVKVGKELESAAGDGSKNGAEEEREGESE